MKKVTFFDAEYANMTNKSICQFGLICENPENGESVYPDKDIFINPKDMFEPECTALHNIDAYRVKHAPTFPQIWGEIEKYFTGSIIIGHDVAFDLDALTYALNRYSLDVPALYYIDTKELAEAYLPAEDCGDYSLTALCKHFGIRMLTEHYAYDDALGNADLYKQLVKTYNIDEEKHIHKFEPAHDMLQISVSRFYGSVQSFVADDKISEEEAEYINRWYEAHLQYADHPQIANVLKMIEEIKKDDQITLEEVKQLEKTLKNTLPYLTTSPLSTSTQILLGIIEGIAVDGQINLEECRKIHQWLKDNVVLTGSYAYNKLFALIVRVLADGEVSKEESDTIIDVIRHLQ